MSRVAIDLDALLVALVFDPATYSRNRFFEMYDCPKVRRVRRRAALVRSVAKQLCAAPDVDGAEIAVRQWGSFTEVSYEVPALGVRRLTRLDDMEMAVLRMVVAKRPGSDRLDEALLPRVPDRERVESALARLAG